LKHKTSLPPPLQFVATTSTPPGSSRSAGATFSKDRRYRYRLWRSWGDPELRCVFVGLNPSTADESNDDPTIRKCVGFAKLWGFGAVDVVNLFAFRSTDPARRDIGLRCSEVNGCNSQGDR
jgi:hypothetical protein